MVCMPRGDHAGIMIYLATLREGHCGRPTLELQGLSCNTNLTHAYIDPTKRWGNGITPTQRANFKKLKPLQDSPGNILSTQKWQRFDPERPPHKFPRLAGCGIPQLNQWWRFPGAERSLSSGLACDPRRICQLIPNFFRKEYCFKKLSNGPWMWIIKQHASIT